MGGELLALIPGQRADEVIGQLPDAGLERIDHQIARAVIPQAGQQHVPGVPLDQRRDRRLPPHAEDQITLPVPGHRTILDLGRPLGDHHHPRDPPPRLHPPPRPARRAPGPQLRGQLPAQLPAGLHEQRPIDRLVTDPHLPIIGILALQSGRDLLRRPEPLKPRLDRRQQPRQPTASRLRPPRAPLRTLLSPHRPIPPPPPVPRQLATHRRRRATQRPRDLPHPPAPTPTAPDPRPLLIRKPPPRIRHRPPTNAACPAPDTPSSAQHPTPQRYPRRDHPPATAPTPAHDLPAQPPNPLPRHPIASNQHENTIVLR